MGIGSQNRRIFDFPARVHLVRKRDGRLHRPDSQYVDYESITRHIRFHPRLGFIAFAVGVVVNVSGAYLVPYKRTFIASTHLSISVDVSTDCFVV